MQKARSVHVRISGRVQGVGFRAWTARTATGLGLGGWVKNVRDGTVEAAFKGPAEAVAEMLRRCERGPAHAEVASVDVLGEADVEGTAFVTVRGD